MTTNPYISAKNKDNDTKLSGYDPWGLPSTSRMSWMTLSSMSPVGNPQRILDFRDNRKMNGEKRPIYIFIEFHSSRYEQILNLTEKGTINSDRSRKYIQFYHSSDLL